MVKRKNVNETEEWDKTPFLFFSKICLLPFLFIFYFFFPLPSDILGFLHRIAIILNLSDNPTMAAQTFPKISTAA